MNKREGLHKYISTFSEFKRALFPNIKRHIKEIKKKGYFVIVISNQAGIGKGLVPQEEYNKIVDYMKKVLGVDDVFTCPHDYDKETCNCRKPNPYMIWQAADKYGIYLPDSWMVGDKDTDILCGNLATCKTFQVNEKIGLKQFVEKVIKNE